MPTITAVADQIIAEDLPALFVDTCILLDVIRSIKLTSSSIAGSSSSRTTSAVGGPLTA